MKALFKYIRQGKLDEVKRILFKNPELCQRKGRFFSGNGAAYKQKNG